MSEAAYETRFMENQHQDQQILLQKPRLLNHPTLQNWLLLQGMENL